MEWKSFPVIEHNGVSVELCQAIGKGHCVPKGASNQPKYRNVNSSYQFDTNEYRGPESFQKLTKALKDACVGCDMYIQNNSKELNSFQLRCSCYKVHKKKDSDFDDNKFTKKDVIPAKIMKTSSTIKSAWSRMSNPNMKYRPKVKQSEDRRKGKKKEKVDQKRRTATSRATSNKTRCPMNIRVYMNNSTGSWHLHSKDSCLSHKFHPPIDSDATTFEKDDLTDEQLNTLNLLFESGVAPHIIAKIMTKSVRSTKNIKGEFLTQTILNIGNLEKRALDKVSGINPEWSSAKKMVAELDRYVSVVGVLICENTYPHTNITFNYIIFYAYLIFYVHILLILGSPMMMANRVSLTLL
ncbi:MAG: hypothetical protein GY874_14445 [Desulfobacteraceae bacterium]|nr:hypothetical protein [Desulfobacteraceae bacterium]